MIEPLCCVDVTAVARWIAAIPFTAWPQQTLVPGERPAMVNDLAWHGFGVVTDALVAEVMAYHGPGRRAVTRMLSVVLPGAEIEPHRDPVAPTWLTRVHVPIAGDAGAMFELGGTEYHLELGRAYTVDIRQIHSVRNAGRIPRIHLMWDVLAR